MRNLEFAAGFYLYVNKHKTTTTTAAEVQTGPRNENPQNKKAQVQEPQMMGGYTVQRLVRDKYAKIVYKKEICQNKVALQTAGQGSRRARSADADRIELKLMQMKIKNEDGPFLRFPPTVFWYDMIW